MKQRHINVTLTIAALTLTALLILTTLPRASTASPRLERRPLESMTALNSSETTESSAPAPASVVQSSGTTTSVSAALRSSPVMFIENVGQFPDDARFQVRGGTGTMWLAEDTIWITVFEQRSKGVEEPRNDSPPHFRTSAPAPRRGVNLKLSFPGANPHPRIEPFDRLDTVVSYFIGNDPDQWYPNVPVWGGVCYKDLYPGIDLELTSENGRLMQRIVARPGANPNAVALRVDGADTLTLDSDRLRLTTALGELTLPLLQVVGVSDTGLTNPTLTGNQIALPFALAITNHQSTIANPQSGASDLLYSTFLGGSNGECLWPRCAFALDGNGAAYITGETYSSDFPTTPGAFDTTLHGSSDAFVVKLNSSGSALAYVIFLGGGSGEWGLGIAVDGGGAAYVTGRTESPDFPATPGAFDTTHNGSRDVFVVKLTATGSALVYATLLGGDNWDEGDAIDIDEAGSAYVTGVTISSDFPTTPGAFDTSHNGSFDAFLVKLNATSSALAYATFLGGREVDWGEGIAVDGSGAAYVTGRTESSGFPTPLGALDTTYNGDFDAFVAKLNPSGSVLTYATFLGGSDLDGGYGIAVDGSGAAYATGETRSSDFPTTLGAFDTTHSGGTCGTASNLYPCPDAFVVKLNATGSALAYATFLGGSYGECLWPRCAIVVDGSRAAYIAGVTDSSDFPTTPDAFDTTCGTDGNCDFDGTYRYGDAFVAKLNATGSALVYATFLGGSGYDDGQGIAVDASGVAYVAGETWFSDFPTTPGAFDTTFNGGSDAFVAKLAVEPNAQNVELVGQIGGATNAVAVQGDYAYLGVGPRLVVLDVSNPANPTSIGQAEVFPGVVADLFVSGSFAYVAVYRAGLRVVNISDPANPYETGYYATLGDAQDVFVSGSYAYIADGDLWVVDISDPANPHEVGSYATPGDVQDVFVSGSYAYVVDGGLWIVDVSDPTNPYEVGYYDTLGDVFVSGSYAYVADGGGLQVVDVSDPANPYEVGYYHALGAGVWGVFVSGSYAYVTGGAEAAYNFLLVVDISDPANPYAVSYYYTSGSAQNVVFVSGSYAYVADSYKGLWVVDVSNPANPYEVGYYTSGWAEDIFVSGSYAYALGGGLGVVDVSNPANPHEVGYCDTREGATDIFVSGSYAYIMAWCPWCPVIDMAGLQVVNISDPANPYEVGYYDYEMSIPYSVFVSGSYAYVVVDGDLRIMDVSNPHNPYEVGYYDTPGDAWDVYVVGSLAYAVGNSSYPNYEGRLWFIDVSDPANPREIGYCHTPESAEAIFVSGCHVYVIENSGYPDYEAGLRIIDVCNPANPLVGYLDIQDASDVFVSGSYAYVAAGSLRVVDVSDPANPHEVGYYYTPGFAQDVFVSDSYAYVADGDGGLIILRFTGGVPTFSISGQVTDDAGAAVAGATVTASGPANVSTTGSDGRYTLSNLPAGTYSVSASKAGYASPAARSVTVPPNAANVDFVLRRQTYSISGQVTDGCGAPVPSATVSASGPANVSTTTGSDGRYTLSNLPGGTYSVSASETGYTSPAARSVTVPPNATNVDFILQTACSAAQWRGEYYNNRDLQGTPACVRCDSNIDFYWGDSSPKPGVVNTDNFSVRWTQDVDFSQTGWYRLRTFTDDGLRLYVDGERIIDDWTPRTFAERSAGKQLTQGTHQVKMEYVEWANDAMAHLDWYLCPNGAGDCSVNIMPQYQTWYPDVPMPTVCPNWQNLPGETKEQSFYNYGCWVTSFAMALQKLGVDTNPTELNEWLSGEWKPGKMRGYQGQCDANLDPTWIPAFAFNWGRQHGRSIILKLAYPTTRDEAYDLIRHGTPVLMHNNRLGHFFLAVDVAKSGGAQTFGINDPWHSWGCRQIPIPRQDNCASGLTQPTKHVITLSTAPYFEAYDRAHYLKVVPSFVSSLGFAIDNAEILVTDAQGRRTGFNPVTGQIVNEIPESMYFDSKVIPPGGTDDGRIRRVLVLPDNAGGNYRIEVFGRSTGALTTSASTASNAEIQLTGFDSQFNPKDATITTTVQPGSVATFDVTFSPGQPIIVAPHCPGDANGDNVVNAVDFSVLLSEWGRNCNQQPCRADFSQDSIVNAVDFSILLANWGTQCP